MPEHVGALALDFVFEQLRVTVMSYRNGRRVGEEVNAVVEAPWRMQIRQLDEDVCELREQQGKQFLVQ